MASSPEGVPGPLGRPSRDPRPQPPWAPGHLILFPARRPAVHLRASFELFAGLGLGRREPVFLLAHVNLQNACSFVEDVWKTRGRRRHLPAFSLEDANQLNRINNIFFLLDKFTPSKPKRERCPRLPSVFQTSSRKTWVFSNVSSSPCLAASKDMDIAWKTWTPLV